VLFGTFGCRNLNFQTEAGPRVSDLVSRQSGTSARGENYKTNLVRQPCQAGGVPFSIAIPATIRIK